MRLVASYSSASPQTCTNTLKHGLRDAGITVERDWTMHATCLDTQKYSCVVTAGFIKHILISTGYTGLRLNDLGGPNYGRLFIVVFIKPPAWNRRAVACRMVLLKCDISIRVLWWHNGLQMVWKLANITCSRYLLHAALFHSPMSMFTDSCKSKSSVSKCQQRDTSQLSAPEAQALQLSPHCPGRNGFLISHNQFGDDLTQSITLFDFAEVTRRPFIEHLWPSCSEVYVRGNIVLLKAHPTHCWHWKPQFCNLQYATTNASCTDHLSTFEVTSYVQPFPLHTSAYDCSDIKSTRVGYTATGRNI